MADSTGLLERSAPFWIVVLVLFVLLGINALFVPRVLDEAARQGRDARQWKRLGYAFGGLALLALFAMRPKEAAALAVEAVAAPGADVGAGSGVRPRIHVQHAVKSFDDRVVVFIKDLMFGDHPIEGLIGPNGAGKTTLMRMIMHSTSLDYGTVTLEPTGEPGVGEVVLSNLPAHRMADLGVVKSNQVIMDFEKLTIWDSLLLSLADTVQEQPYRIFEEKQLFADRRDEAEHYLEYFGFADPFGYAMSAGEKKLLDIVRCLLLKPRFLMLDEPTAGLPDEMTEKVMGEIRRLADTGTAIVIVEHDLNVIWNLCDEVHFMAEGDVILGGTPEDIREHRTVVEKYLGEGHV